MTEDEKMLVEFVNHLSLEERKQILDYLKEIVRSQELASCSPAKADDTD